MTFNEWYSKLGYDTRDHDGLERYIRNLMGRAWDDGIEEWIREEEDRHEQNDARST